MVSMNGCWHRPIRMPISLRMMLLLASTLLLFGCGGGGTSGTGSNGGGATTSVAPLSKASSSIVSASVNPTSSKVASSVSSSLISSSIANSSVSFLITLSGKITYDFVPHNANQIGLNYNAIERRPGRGLTVELLGESNQVLMAGVTDNSGNYAFAVERNKLVKVRAKAQLSRLNTPSWNFKVTDNTSNNALYVMDGSLLAVSDTNAVRDLHASSGWTGTDYTQPRVAAPFAILDSVLIAAERVLAAGNTQNFPALELRWSIDNKAADGDLSLGEIGTSFFSGTAIYVLGDANNDTDEYDPHVILHEWGHYLEGNFSRSDSIGGDHSYGDKLDMRVAMSEGFANAFSAMMLDDPDYRDASGAQQLDGFSNNVSRKVHSVRGWYSEASLQSIFYNFYVSSIGKVARNFTDILSVINSAEYTNTTALTSIYVFADELRTVLPAQVTNFNNLLVEQNIEITDAFGVDESNSGGYTGGLPVYKTLPSTNTVISLCSTNRFGSYNKLANAQFMILNVASSGTYQISVQEGVDDSGNSDPDLYLYQRGSLLAFAEGTAIDQENLSRFLSVGVYLVELVDDRVKNSENASEITACFDVRAQRLN
jgi:hypothetical protein